MRYKLDNAGYVCAVAFGCFLDSCTEYTGAVPTGYNNLDEWATYACIQAYYISNGNLVLDSERLTECQNRQVQEAIDNAPLYRKDLYENDEVLDSQYIRQTATGKLIVLNDIKTIAPRVKITGIEPYDYGKLKVITQGRNMMPCTANGETVTGVIFRKNPNGSLSVIGKATANIEYVISECDFTLKANEDYYLNLGEFSCELRFNDNGEIAQQYVGASGLINVPKDIEVSQVVIKIPNGQTVNKTFFPQLEVGKSFTSYEAYKCKSIEIDFSEYVKEALFPSDALYPSDTLYPIAETVINYILIENGTVSVSVDGIPHLLTGGAVGLFGSCSTIYANEDVTLEVEYSTKLIDVDSLEFLQGKSTTTNQFRILKDGSIEAHNGYFSGRIEADSGYFKGEISWEQITGNEDVANKTDIPTDNKQLANGSGYTTMTDVEAKGYQNAIQVTNITKDTVTAPFVKTLGLTVGNEIQMGENATISWGNVTNQPTIPTNTNQLTNGAGYTTMSAVEGKGYTTMTAVEGKGYQTATQVTKITKDTVTTSYVNALNVKAGSVDAENITGTTIKGKKLEGVTGEIGGFTIGTSAIYAGSRSSFSSSLSGIYIGTDGISIGANSYNQFKVTSDGEVSILGVGGNITLGSTSTGIMMLDKDGIRFGYTSYNTEITKDKVQVYDNYIDTNGLRCGNTSYYTEITNAEVLINKDYDSFIKMDYKDITLGSGDTHKIIHGTTDLMSLMSNAVMIYPTYSLVGKSDGYLGFFGSSTTGTCSKKKSVSTITSTSTATASTIATKLNELINALKAYNLIG